MLTFTCVAYVPPIATQLNCWISTADNAGISIYSRSSSQLSLDYDDRRFGHTCMEVERTEKAKESGTELWNVANFVRNRRRNRSISPDWSWPALAGLSSTFSFELFGGGCLLVVTTLIGLPELKSHEAMCVLHRVIKRNETNRYNDNSLLNLLKKSCRAIEIFIL